MYFLGILLSEKNLEIVTDEEAQRDVDTAFEWIEQGVNFRLNVFRDRDGLAFVMRVLASLSPLFRKSVYLPKNLARYQCPKARSCFSYWGNGQW